MSPANTNRRPARPAASTSRKPSGPAPAKSASSKRLPIALIAGVALAIGLVVVIVLTMGSGGGDTVELGTPVITGGTLPEFETVLGDTAVGMTIPEVTGTDFADVPVSISLNGKPKVLVFFAHWCGVCQQEVPLVAGWLPGAVLPENLEWVSVSTGVNPNAANYPPSAWLEREGWEVPVIRDNAQSSVATAFGLSAYPYFVFVNADGTVALRATGGLGVDALEEIISQLVGA